MCAAYHFQKQPSAQPWPAVFSLLLLGSCLFSLSFVEAEEREEAEMKKN